MSDNCLVCDKQCQIKLSKLVSIESNGTQMKKFKSNKILVFSFIFIFSNAIAGNGYEIKKHVISSGGGLSEGGNYKVNGSIAQMTTEKSIGGGYVINSGFWQNNSDLIFKNNFE